MYSGGLVRTAGVPAHQTPTSRPVRAVCAKGFAPRSGAPFYKLARSHPLWEKSDTLRPASAQERSTSSTSSQGPSSATSRGISLLWE
jgi:hypothetical protein